MHRNDTPRGGYRGTQDFDRDDEDARSGSNRSASGTDRGYGREYGDTRNGGTSPGYPGASRMTDDANHERTSSRGHQSTHQGYGSNPGNREAYGDRRAENEYGQSSAFSRDEEHRSGSESRQARRGGSFGQGPGEQTYTNRYFGKGQNDGQGGPNSRNRYDQHLDQGAYAQDDGNQGYGPQRGSYGAGSRQSYGQHDGSGQGEYGSSPASSHGQNRGAMDEWGFGSPFAPRGWSTERSTDVGRDRSAARDRQDEGRFVGRGPKNYQRSDDRIREDICDRLMSGGRFDASDVEVAVKAGEVTLTGTVRGRQDKYAAEDLADGILGVKDVNNQLRVKRASDENRAEPDSDKQPQQQQTPQSSVRPDADKSATSGLNSGRQTASMAR